MTQNWTSYIEENCIPSLLKIQKLKSCTLVLQTGMYCIRATLYIPPWRRMEACKPYICFNDTTWRVQAIKLFRFKYFPQRFVTKYFQHLLLVQTTNRLSSTYTSVYVNFYCWWYSGTQCLTWLYKSNGKLETHGTCDITLRKRYQFFRGSTKAIQKLSFKVYFLSLLSLATHFL
jgi:hypothetical protein